MDRRVTIEENAELTEPILLAAWPGMGLVGLKTVQYIQSQFESRRVAYIDAGEFFQCAGVSVKNGVLASANRPKSEFFSVHPTGSGHSLLLFIGDEQPAGGKEYTFASLVIDVAKHFGVNRIVTAAAMVTSLHHSEPSRLWAAATSAELLSELPPDSYVEVKDGHIGGLNGLLLGVARERGMDGYCLLGEIPYYVTNLENPKASVVILEYLENMLGFSLDKKAIKDKAAYVQSQVDSAVRQVRADVTASKLREADEPEDDDEHGTIN